MESTLQAKLENNNEEEIYMDQLEGFTFVGEEQMAYCLQSIQDAVQCTWPDVAFALSITTEHQVFATEEHWSAVKTIIKVNGGMVAWKSSKQATMVDSTTESEYTAALETAKEAVWLKNYIQELGVVPSITEPVVIVCDNNRTIAQAKELRSHHQSKHILRCYHLLREMVSRGDIRMDQVSSAENIADQQPKLVT
ncbi:UNVERIFIED_CONTAM: Retrovirus-related Pol polyprotein from transposon TNT 1-94 [Sesamum calycinum]|uniref:Retrovirus-related Pol polyprotein from transposon TNT 1-94 n=1 Tax=Sesamum calycinum TaxID=2727403 RepID=A0AAW2SV90_9LAMI